MDKKVIERYTLDYATIEDLSKETFIEMLSRLTEFLNSARNSSSIWKPELQDIMPLIYINCSYDFLTKEESEKQTAGTE